VALVPVGKEKVYPLIGMNLCLLGSSIWACYYYKEPEDDLEAEEN